MGEEKQKKKDKKTSNEADAKKPLEIKSDSGDKMPVSMQIVIGFLAVVVLGLLGYIMYQSGKGNTSIKGKNDLTVREEVGSDSDNDRLVESSLSNSAIDDSNNSANDVVNANLNNEENSVVASSDLKLSKDDMDKLNSDIDKFSTDDDEFKEVRDVFDKNL